MGSRVYIAKITFTTLIDHFTSYMPQAPVYSNQLIKFELLTQSTRQQKLPTARPLRGRRFSAFDPAVRMALADEKNHRRSLSCFGKLTLRHMRFCRKVRSQLFETDCIHILYNQIVKKSIKMLKFLHKYIIMIK